jgi:pimeloyl-ACP methyl ester carboxylesterase
MTVATLAIPSGSITLPAELSLPVEALGLVVFVHGSGSNRFSPRNQLVAAWLQQAGLGTVLFDLLTAEEAERDRCDGSLRFRIDLFCDRLLDILSWLACQPRLAALFPVGLFGASSGAAVALQVAARCPEAVAAVVSRGGRPDLAGDALAGVRAPTLLIVGGDDGTVLRLNREAAARIHGPHRLEVIPAASHLFEEPGTLERAAQLSCDWFLSQLPASRLAAGPGIAPPPPVHGPAAAGERHPSTCD